MLDIVALSAPIFVSMAAGSIAVFAGLMNAKDARSLGTFVLYFGLPAVIVRAMSQRPMAEIFNARYLLAYGAASLVVLLGGYLVARRLRRLSAAESAIYAFGVSVSNSGFIGYPLAALAVGPPAVVALALNMMVENILCIPLALILMELGTQERGSMVGIARRLARQLAVNPILLSILLGGSLSLGGATLPRPVVATLDILADAAAPLALFTTGVMVAGLSTRGVRGAAAEIAFGKLVVHPIAVAVAFAVLAPGIDVSLRTAAIVFASVPMVSIYPILGERYGAGALASAAMVTAVTAAFATLNVVLWVFE